MKQTNNALKFLLAQYRAIFKNAYVKGLAAVALTAGLAISAAQPANAAYSLVSADDTATSGTGWSSLKADTTYKVDGAGTTAGTFSKIELSGSLTNPNNFILDITSGGDANKIITDGAVTDVKAVNATINLNGGTNAKLLISGNGTSGAALTVGTFSIGNSTSGGTLILQGAQDAGAGSLTANTIKLNSGSIVFSGTSAGAAVLTGMLDTSEASTSLGTLDFTGASGTISAWGDNQSLNIKVDGSNKAASAVLNLTGSGDKSRLGIDSGTFTLTAGTNAASGATFTISGGTLALGDDVTLAVTGQDAGSGQAVIALSNTDSAANAVLEISSEKLAALLTAKAQVNITKGTIQLTDSGLDLAESGLKFSDTAGPGVISGASTDASIIQGTGLKISSALTNASKITVASDTLELTEVDGGLGVGATLAESYTLNLRTDQTGDAATTFTNTHKMQFATVQESLSNPFYDASDTTNFESGNATLKYAGTGSLGNVDIEVSGASADAGTLEVLAGHYTGSNDITLNSGSLIVGAQEDGDPYVGIDASLTLTGGLTLQHRSQSNTITVQGNSGEVAFGKTTDYKRVATAVLDLRQADLEITDGNGKFTTINVNTNGQLLISESQFADILDLNNARANSGAGILISGGTVTVDGEINDTNVDIRGISVGQLSGTSAATDNIAFGNAGGRLEADSITLRADGNSAEDKNKALKIGAGVLAADTITLNQQGTDAKTQSRLPFEIQSGTLEVASALNSNTTLVKFGNDAASSGSDLVLGYIDPVMDATYGIRADNTGYETSSATGTVSVNLEFAGSGASADADKSDLEVVYGNWTVRDITATNSDITVGQTEANQKRDAAGNVYTAALNGAALKLGTGAKLTVNSNATASFATLDLSNGASGSVKNTTLTIEGDYVAPVAGGNGVAAVEESWGLATANNATISVEGRQGKLILGADAVSGISDTATTTYANKNTNQKTAFVALSDWATLELGLGSGVSFDKDGLASLREDFIVKSSLQNGLVAQGFIDIGEATIDGLTDQVSGGTISWNTLEEYKDIIADILQNDLQSAVLVDVGAGDTVQANVAAIKVDGSLGQVQLGDTNLYDASKNSGNNFFVNENNESIDAQITAGAHVSLNNGGNAEVIGLATGTTYSPTELAIVSTNPNDGTTNHVTKLLAVRGAKSDTLLTIDGETEVTQDVEIATLEVNDKLTVAGKTTVYEGLFSDVDSEGNLVTTGDLNVTTLDVTGGAEYAGNLTATGTATFGKLDGTDTDSAGEPYTYYLAGNNSFKDVTFYNDVEFDNGGKTTATTLNVGDSLGVFGNAEVYADVLQFTAGNTTKVLQVGEDAGSDESTGETWESSAGYLSVGRLDLNGGVLLVDPDYSKPASMVAVDRFGQAVTEPDADAGNVNGDLVALRNSVIAIGVSDSDPTDAISVFEEIRNTFGSNYFNENGSLSNAEGKVGSIAYIADNVTFDAGSTLVLDANKTGTQYATLVNSTTTPSNTADATFLEAIRNNEVYLGANTALAISDTALNKVNTVNNPDGTTTTTPIAAMHFNTTGASVYGAGGKIVLVGTNFDPQKEVMLFSDNDTAEGQNGVEIVGGDINVESLSGVLVMTLHEGETTKPTTLTVNNAALQEAWYAASDPVADLLDRYSAAYTNSAVVPANSLLGERAEGVNYDPATGFSDTTQTYVAVENGAGGYDVYYAPANALLSETVNNDYSGAIAETAARLGAYAGVAQAALAAGASTYDAISGRMGIGADASAMTFADNGQGAGLWATPIYKNHDSDGFDADGVDYGVDMNLYGVALGADYTLSNGLRVGAMFNIGSGDADGQGAGSQASNDFDYYGFGLYAGYTMGQFSVVGDISYTAVDNDVEATLGSFDTVGASLDSTNLSFGVTGKYEFDFNGLYVTPHAGLRYSTIDIDDYDVDGEQVYAHFAADSIDVFSVPVGVTVAKEITAGSWTVKPAFDVTLTGNFGDDSFDSFDGDVSWAGIENATTATSTEVLDNFTYGATLGVGAKTGNFSLGLGVNYTGSSNTDEFGVNANARYVF